MFGLKHRTTVAREPSCTLKFKSVRPPGRAGCRRIKQERSLRQRQDEMLLHSATLNFDARSGKRFLINNRRSLGGGGRVQSRSMITIRKGNAGRVHYKALPRSSLQLEKLPRAQVDKTARPGGFFKIKDPGAPGKTEHIRILGRIGKERPHLNPLRHHLSSAPPQWPTDLRRRRPIRTGRRQLRRLR